MKTNIKKLTFSATIGAIYFLFCFVQQDFASGIIQCRLSEALCLLPLFFPEAIIGVTIGCLLFNLTHGILYDIIFGTLTTLIAAIITYIIGKFIKNDYLKIILGGLPPILLNGLIIPLVIIFGMGSTESYLFLFMTISIGELIAIYVVGGLMYFPLKKMFEGFGINSQ